MPTKLRFHLANGDMRTARETDKLFGAGWRGVDEYPADDLEYGHYLALVNQVDDGVLRLSRIVSVERFGFDPHEPHTAAIEREAEVAIAENGGV